MDPDVPWDEAVAVEAIQAAGFRQAGHILLKDKAMFDISGTEEDLLARMKPKHRYNLRLAEKKGIQIVEGTGKDFARRIAFIKRPASATGSSSGHSTAAGRNGSCF